MLSDLTEVKHEILLSLERLSWPDLPTNLSKLDDEVSRVLITSRLLSQQLTSLVFIATGLSSYTDLFVTPDSLSNQIHNPLSHCVTGSHVSSS